MELIKIRKLISKGEKVGACDTDLQAFWNGDILELKKGFLSLLLSKKQARELKEWLNSKSSHNSDFKKDLEIKKLKIKKSDSKFLWFILGVLVCIFIMQIIYELTIGKLI